MPSLRYSDRATVLPRQLSGLGRDWCVHTYVCEILRLHVNCQTYSKQGNTTNMNISFSNEKRAAQVGFKPMTYCLLANQSKAIQQT